jgi:hypothetical protein
MNQCGTEGEILAAANWGNWPANLAQKTAIEACIDSEAIRSLRPEDPAASESLSRRETHSFLD